MSADNIQRKKQKALQYLGTQQFRKARDLLLQLNRKASQDPEVYALLGAVYGEMGKFAEAAGNLRKAIQLQPGFVAAHENLARACLQLGLLDEAAIQYLRLAELQPNISEWYYSLGQILAKQDQYEKALPVLARAVALQPDHAFAWNALGHVQMGLGVGVWAALESFQRVVKYSPDWPQGQADLGFALATVGQLDGAQLHFQTALSLEPGRTATIAGLATLHQRQGDCQSAMELLQPVLDRQQELAKADVDFALVFSRVAQKLNTQADAIPRLEGLLGQQEVSRPEKQGLHFQLGKLFESSHDYRQAFHHFQASNALKCVCAEDQFSPQMHNAMQMFTAEYLALSGRAGNTDRRPVFIIGMPRTGTSLVEEILASHPEVFAGGELDDIRLLAQSVPRMAGSSKPFPGCMPEVTAATLDTLAQRYLNRLAEMSSEAHRITDKMPHNFMYLGLIEMLFPEARVIHCHRDPVDTCVSIFTNDFLPGHGYATELNKLGAHYRLYQQLMEHWHRVLRIPVLDICYEELVEDPAAGSRKIIEFCGLEWDERCLRFYENERIVITHSYDQVRRPVYRQSVGRWRHYEPWLGELLESLDIH